MEFRVKQGNYLKSNDSTRKMMFHLLLSLLPIILYSFYKNGILPYIKGYTNIYMLFKPLIMVIIPSVICLFTEYVWYKYIQKTDKTIKELLIKTYSIIPGIFLGLILPINTNILILIIGSVFASVIGKLVYGGFGHNIFNPALVGRIFIIASYGAIIMSNGGYLNALEKVDTISSATPLTNLSSINYIGTYDQIVAPYGTLLDFLVGNIPGSIGETCKILCILGFIYLAFIKVIKWRIPIYYIATVFTLSFIIGINNDLGIWYPLFHILSGGLLFGAVFMATDPITSPISINACRIYGICLGILTIVFRFLTPYPEGVLSSILFMNLLVPIFNKWTIKYRFNNKKYIPLIVVIIVGILLAFYIGNNIKNNKVETPIVKTYLNIINEERIGNETIYQVKYRGFTNKEAIEAKITFSNKTIIGIEITNILDHYYDSYIKNTGYLNTLIINQSDLSQVDTISGATYTSKYLKDMIKEIASYHGAKYE